MKTLRQKIMTKTVNISTYFSICDTFLNISTEGFVDTTQPHEFKWKIPEITIVLVFPAATNLYFPYEPPLNDEVSLCPFIPLSFPPWGQKWSKVKAILIPQHRKPRTTKHKPNSSHNALELANLDSLPQRSASILNGNYGTQTHMHTQHLDCSNEMQKTKRREGGVLGK